MATAQLDDLAKAVQMASERFTHGLDCVPDDRLNWKPSETAPSALELAGKVAGFVRMMTNYIHTQQMPQRDPNAPRPEPSTDREHAKAAITAAYSALHGMIQELSDADLEKTLVAPWGKTVTVAEFIWWAPGVLFYYQGQMNYLQLVYGDTQPNFPPSWSPDQADRQ